jgi:uncharacterized integral membrane protein
VHQNGIPDKPITGADYERHEEVMLMEAKVVLVLVLVLIAIVIMIQNTGVVALHLLFWNVSMSLILLILISLLIGFIIGYVLGKGFKMGK